MIGIPDHPTVTASSSVVERLATPRHPCFGSGKLGRLWWYLACCSSRPGSPPSVVARD
nr:MAG TPA: hypothetical protein [Caudoviricetes sp.]